MTHTEKKYWENGYQIRGGWFKTWAFSFGDIGIMITNGKPLIEIFKLI